MGGDPSTELIIVRICAPLSVLGSGLIIGSYALFKETRTPGRELLACLSIADLVMSVGFLLPTEPDALCRINGGIAAAFCCASFMYSGGIAIYIYLSISEESTFSRNRFLKKYVYYLHLLCWGYPFLILMFLWIQNVQFKTTNQPWCFIDQNQPGATAMRLAIIYIPVWISLMISLMAYVGVYWTANSILTPFRKRTGDHIVQTRPIVSSSVTANSITQHSHEESATVQIPDKRDARIDETHEVFNRLVLIPLVFIVLRMWGSINRLYEMISGQESYYAWLDYMQSFGDTSQGWINCIFFVMMSRRVRGRYVEVMERAWSTLFRTGPTEFDSVHTQDEAQTYDVRNAKLPSINSPLLDPEELEEEAQQ